jgi:proteasome beta subunit
MTIPIFGPGEDPGPSFTELLRRTGRDPFATIAASDTTSYVDTHATPICALTYVDGVVMAADRRATAGSSIAQRDVRKLHAADRHSGIAIAGSAGFGLEMIRIFQLELEHYEKSEGIALSLEGKANQLAGMVRQHLGLAMQGFVVVPLFAGYDTRRGVGRIYTYDPTGGRAEEGNFHADGSGGRDARTTIKLGWLPGMTREAAIELAVQALYEAADEDSATGGPDAIRGIYPTVATITAAGFEAVDDTEVAARFAALIDARSSRGAVT